jgi:uncharacterized repeat protein (TIGR03803 family)
MSQADHNDRTVRAMQCTGMLTACGLRELWLAAGALAFVLALSGNATAQTYKAVHYFCATTNTSGYCLDGQYSIAAPIVGHNGDLYGMTNQGGANDLGTIFKMTPGGKLTTLYNFCSLVNCLDGYYPHGSLLLAKNGKFYGTTIFGGPGNYGTVFEITAAGAHTILYTFCSQPSCTDGNDPGANLVQGANGNLYGTTEYGGPHGGGTVFELTAAGKLTTLYTFCKTVDTSGNCPDGRFPVAGLSQGTNGNFYGTTSLGGANGDYGTVFEITPAGKFTTLYSFCPQAGSCPDGYSPSGSLVQATDGNLYGIAGVGGANGSFGTVFELTLAGKLTTLHSFCATLNGSGYCADGRDPFGGLIQATDGNLYGTTIAGGAIDTGTVYEITPAGTLTTIYNFCSQASCADGGYPLAGLVQAPSGPLYGMTSANGKHNDAGTVYTMSIGLGPFVSTIPSSGKAGAAVAILGTNLTGATSVTFNGTPAAYTVVSATEIKTTVPAGATTGTVSVTTPAGVLNSNVAFRIP